MLRTGFFHRFHNQTWQQISNTTIHFKIDISPDFFQVITEKKIIFAKASIEVEIVAIVTKISMSVINTFWICYNHSYYQDNYIFQEITNFLRCHIPILALSLVQGSFFFNRLLSSKPKKFMLWQLSSTTYLHPKLPMGLDLKRP